MDVLKALLPLLFCVSSFAQYIDNQDFPIKSSIFATVTVALLSDEGRHSPEWYEYVYQFNRQNIQFYEDQGNFAVMAYIQPQPAPLVYVIPGVGGGEDSGTSNWLAEKFFDQGFSVISLPSIFSWGFSLRGSTNGIVGNIPEDTRNLYMAAYEAETRLARDYGLQVTKRGMIGYSLGGLTITHMIDWDNKLQLFNFDRSLIMNPPVDLRYGVDVLDRQYQVGESWPAAERQRVMRRAFELIQDLGDKPVEDLIADGIEDKIDLTEAELEWLIGRTFRSALKNIVFVSQQVNDLGVLQTPSTRATRAARMREAGTFDFMQYIEKFVYLDMVNQGEQRSVNQIIDDVSLLGRQDILENDPNVYLMHNEDDFLMRPGDGQLLLNLMGDRARIYARGGHVGNLWHPDNLAYIFQTFEVLK